MLATLIIALGAAVFVNWYYTKPDIASAGTEGTLSSTEQDSLQGANMGDARYVNSTTVSADDVAAQAKATEYFASAKLRRQNAHDEAAEALNGIIKDSSSSADAVSDASEVLGELSESIALESDLENLIYAKAGCENLVILNGGTAEIIVENGSLDDVSLVKIKEIVVKQTGLGVDKISITEMEY